MQVRLSPGDSCLEIEAMMWVKPWGDGGQGCKTK